jgi:hypothetical protein
MRMRTAGLVIAFAVVIACLAAIIAGVVLTERKSAPLGAYRFRLTVTVDVDGQTKSGSSVIEITNRPQLRLSAEMPSVVYGITGDAVFVDLGSNRNILALLTMTPSGGGADSFIDLAPRVFDFSSASVPPRIPLGSTRMLTGSNIPLLVTFDDLRRPISLRVVRPEDFEAVFGPGVRLQSVTMETTDAPITRGIAQHLPWLDALAKRGGSIDGSFAANSNDPLNNLGALSFRK